MAAHEYGVSFVLIKAFGNQREVMVVHFCECPTCHSLVHLKMYNG